MTSTYLLHTDPPLHHCWWNNRKCDSLSFWYQMSPSNSSFCHFLGWCEPVNVPIMAVHCQHPQTPDCDEYNNYLHPKHVNGDHHFMQIHTPHSFLQSTIWRMPHNTAHNFIIGSTVNHHVDSSSLATLGVCKSFNRLVKVVINGFAFATPLATISKAVRQLWS